jgi:uncharacterized caspase-like protein/Tol biopolymer transport system component
MSRPLRSSIVFLAAIAALGAIPPARAATNGGEKYAIVIGVQRYSEAKGFASLRYAERDAQAFHDVLVDTQRGGYDEAHVKLFSTAAQDQEQLPVRGNVLAALNQLEEWAGLAPDNTLDTVLVYFSGHGLASGGESYLIPSDASRNDLASTAIGLEDLRSRLERSGAKKQIIILDACRFDTTPGKGTGDRQSIEFARKLETLAEAEGRAVLVSCSENEASYEDDTSRHSAFTTFLLEGLLGNADGNHDGTITVTESHDYTAAGLLSWARTRALKQTPKLYGEITLTMPLVRCPLWAELRITSVPDGAEVWIDGENTGQTTPCTEKLKLDGALQRTLRVTLKKKGYEDLEKEVGLRAGVVAEITLPLEGQRRPGVHVTPSLKPTSTDWTADTFFSGTGRVTGLAPRPDGSLLLAVASPHVVPQGLYLAYEGDLCDPSDAYTDPGAPFHMPGSVMLHPDGPVLVADPSISTIWMVPAAGAPPQVLTREIAEPHDILVAPPGFEGPNVDPGDLLVCGGSSRDAAAGGLYAIDQDTGAVRRLAGPPELRNGLVDACFGPDGKLYAMEDDAARDGIRVVTISPNGSASPVLDNWQVSPQAPQAGPLAVHPVTGEIYFAYGPTVYRVSDDRRDAEPFAMGGSDVADLVFDAKGDSLLVSDRGAGQVVRILKPSPHAPTVWVVVERGYITSASGTVRYVHRAFVQARDPDGADDIASVTVVDPDGDLNTITPSQQNRFSTDGEHTIHCDHPTIVWDWQESEQAPPPDTGPYTVIATDVSGNRSAPVTTPVIPPPPRDWPRLLSPAPDSVIYTTTPTFEWTDGLRDDAGYVLEVWADGDREGDSTWRCHLGAGIHAAAYNSDGTAKEEQLQPNHTYFWSIEGCQGSDIRIDDPQVWASDVHRSEGRFTVYGEWPDRPPELPGRLAYIATPAYPDKQCAMAYSTDPHAPAYLPGAEWSPDGTKVVYSFFGRIWIDALDGTPPVAVPGASMVNECRWAPDGKSIVYSTVGPWNPFFGKEGLAAEQHFGWEAWHRSGADLGPMDLWEAWSWVVPDTWSRWYGNRDIWVTSVDGSRRYPLADSIECEERWPAWSPDGLWIAYRRRVGPGRLGPPEAEMPLEDLDTGKGLWLVRYDGAERHTLAPTEVIGRPDSGTHINTVAWSPDARSLAVQFNMGPGHGVWAIGVMPAEGGPITPVFVPPPGVECCVGPRYPQWSPDGMKIVFASGHHLPDAGRRDELELGTELWMVNADGSGELVRLTYDNMHQSWSSWWGPNTKLGTNVTVTKGDASVTFENVTESGSTSLVAYVDPQTSLPEGYQFAGRRYELSTTAEVNGVITLEIRYDEDAIPADQQDRLCLLHQQDDRWVNVTIRPIDTQNKLIRGECSSLGTFSLALGPN